MQPEPLKLQEGERQNSTSLLLTFGGSRARFSLRDGDFILQYCLREP